MRRRWVVLAVVLLAIHEANAEQIASTVGDGKPPRAWIDTDNLIQHHLATTLSVLGSFYEWDADYRNKLERTFLERLVRMQSLSEHELDPTGTVETVFSQGDAPRQRRIEKLKELESIAHHTLHVYAHTARRARAAPSEHLPLLLTCSSLCKALAKERREVPLRTRKQEWLRRAKYLMSAHSGR